MRRYSGNSRDRLLPLRPALDLAPPVPVGKRRSAAIPRTDNVVHAGARRGEHPRLRSCKEPLEPTCNPADPDSGCMQVPYLLEWIVFYQMQGAPIIRSCVDKKA